MFVSHEKNVNKKKYQKPNILRKKPHISVVRPNLPDIESPINTTSIIHYAKLAPHPPTEKIKQEFYTKKTIPKQEVAINVLPESCVSEINLNTSTRQNIFDNNQESFNVESFLNDATKQDLKSTLKEETAADKNWCLGFIDSKEIVLSTYNGSQLCDEDQKINLMSGRVPSAVVKDPLHLEDPIPQDVHSTETSVQNVTINCFASRAIKLKCDEPNCGKGFWSELKLKKHKNAHNKQSRSRTVAQCPVKKINADGVEERCGRAFAIREQLSKHLNEDHTPEDAPYRCSACTRRFFWAAGLRAHRQAQCARGALACAWPGCGKQFRQPCRLREHARAHTGDRPYACPFPECGWSFRSASKLQRHARRHTGERRHVCGACGRAFLRREHLREHCTRCHPPHAEGSPAPGTAPAPGAGAPAPGAPAPGAGAAGTRAPRGARTPRTSRRARARAHNGDDKVVVKPSTTTIDVKCELNDSATIIETVPVTSCDNMFVLSLVPEAKVEIPCGEEENAECDEQTEHADEQCAGVRAARVVRGEGGERGERGDTEWRAARTHCTWPLARTHAIYEHEHEPAEYVLEEDAPAEQSETSENNIYTIRSDLFLHGNVLINEDSEFIVSDYVGRHGGDSGDGGEGGQVQGQGDREAEGGALHAGLDYIDVHPTIDLMPEELMYADAAVDESSFRVFLLNGEELT